MPKYIVLEVGDVACTQYRMKNGEFEETEDAVMVGKIEANSEEEAILAVTELDYCKNREFDNLVAYRLHEA